MSMTRLPLKVSACCLKFCEDRRFMNDALLTTSVKTDSMQLLPCNFNIQTHRNCLPGKDSIAIAVAGSSQSRMQEP